MRIVFSFAIFLTFSNIALAEIIKEGSVICVSQKYLEQYERYKNKDAKVYMNDMLARAQCVIKKKNEEVFELAKVGEYAKVETEDGFKVWVLVDDYVK